MLQEERSSEITKLPAGSVLDHKYNINFFHQLKSFIGCSRSHLLHKIRQWTAKNLTHNLPKNQVSADGWLPCLAFSTTKKVQL